MELVKNITNNKLIKIFLISLLGSILLTISAKIKIPFYPVPMTMQTLIVLLIGIAFGWKSNNRLTNEQITNPEDSNV